MTLLFPSPSLSLSLHSLCSLSHSLGACLRASVCVCLSFFRLMQPAQQGRAGRWPNTKSGGGWIECTGPLLSSPSLGQQKQSSPSIRRTRTHPPTQAHTPQVHARTHAFAHARTRHGSRAEHQGARGKGKGERGPVPCLGSPCFTLSSLIEFLFPYLWHGSKQSKHASTKVTRMKVTHRVCGMFQGRGKEGKSDCGQARRRM